MTGSHDFSIPLITFICLFLNWIPYNKLVNVHVTLKISESFQQTMELEEGEYKPLSV